MTAGTGSCAQLHPTPVELTSSATQPTPMEEGEVADITPSSAAAAEGTKTTSFTEVGHISARPGDKTIVEWQLPSPAKVKARKKSLEGESSTCRGCGYMTNVGHDISDAVIQHYMTCQ